MPTRRIERGRQIDLVGRALDHMDVACGAAARVAGSARRYCRRICTSTPALLSRCAISAVVVDLPLVPVMATNGASGARGARSRQNSSMSPMTSTPALRARARRPVRRRMRQRHAGRQDQRRDFATSRCSRRSRGRDAGCFASSMRAGVSRRSATTSAPPAISALRARAGPSRRGRTARPSCPAKVVTGIIAPRHRSFSVDRPASASTMEMIQNRITICGSVQPELLEVMMDRRHPEHALAGQLERHHLHDHRHGFEHEQAADHRQHDLVLGRDRDRAQHAAERQRAGIAHEDRGRRRVEPQEAQAGADHRAAEHREFAGAGHETDLQIVGEHRVAGQIGR